MRFNPIVNVRAYCPVKYNWLHQVYEEFLPIIPPEMEAMVQNLMTDAVNLTRIITERRLFSEIFFVFTFPNKGNPLSFFFSIVTFSWEIHLYIFTFFFFVCLFVCSLCGTEVPKPCTNQAFPSQWHAGLQKRLPWVCTWGCSVLLEFYGSGHRFRVSIFWGVSFDTKRLTIHVFAINFAKTWR